MSRVKGCRAYICKRLVESVWEHPGCSPCPRNGWLGCLVAGVAPCHHGCRLLTYHGLLLQCGDWLIKPRATILSDNPKAVLSACVQVCNLQVSFTWTVTPLKLGLPGSSQLAEVFAAVDTHVAAQGKDQPAYKLAIMRPRGLLGPAEQSQTLRQLRFPPQASLVVVPAPNPRHGHRPTVRPQPPAAVPAEPAAGPAAEAGQGATPAVPMAAAAVPPVPAATADGPPASASSGAAGSNAAVGSPRQVAAAGPGAREAQGSHQQAVPSPSAAAAASGSGYIGRRGNRPIEVNVYLEGAPTLRKWFDGHDTTLAQVLDYVDAHRTDGRWACLLLHHMQGTAWH